MSSAGSGFPRSRRILSKEGYRLVFADAIRSSDGHLTVLARPNGTNAARLGLAISRKALRRAVDRNRIKRLVREHFRSRQDPLAGLDLVVMARPSCAKASSADLRSSLDQHWHSLLQRCASSLSSSSSPTVSC